jgi:hypothetical protein
MIKSILFVFLVLVLFYQSFASISSGRIKGDDEPHIVSWRVLEGVTEPFESNKQQAVPAWKQMKAAADHKAASLAVQQALHEYGQILRHPYMFGDMPTEERYDIFLSMSKLLKIMGFHQRAELLLYEAMSYTTNPHEAHLQLGLLFLDKEDLEQAKMHLKNCLFFKDNDLLILIHLAVILLAEGKMHEAKFFLSRILSSLEARVGTLSFVLSEAELKSLTVDRVDHQQLSTWVEDLIVKVFYGEFRFTVSATMDMLKLFSNLYKWIADGEMVGRFVFDMGQSLYEGGRPKIGQIMMQRGYDTADAQAEGEVSTAIVNMRLAFDYPVVPDSALSILQAYLNMTSFLSESSQSYVPVDLENVVDLYWPLPLLPWSALPMMPLVKELLWRFEGGPERKDPPSVFWLNRTMSEAVLAQHASMAAMTVASFMNASERHTVDMRAASSAYQLVHKELQRAKLEIGIFGGHMNNHPVGYMVYQRLLALNRAPKNTEGSSTSVDWRNYIRVTLLALALSPDSMTDRIASSVHRIVNIPMDTARAWRLIESLHLDVIVFPDWQPFPDQQSVLFQTRRMAPVQVCIFVRGSSCASSSDAIDYYLLPTELEESYLRGTPAADLRGKVNVSRASLQSAAAPAATTSIAPAPAPAPAGASSSTDGAATTTTVQRPLRPLYKERYAEQVVLLDWPLLTSDFARDSMELAASGAASARNGLGSTGEREGDDPRSVYEGGGEGGSKRDSASGSSGGDDNSDGAADSASLYSPLDIEGKIFFEDQPVAVLPIHPTYMHPLMDDVIFKIMRSVPSLHLVLAMPDSFFAHIHDAKHRISWARKLVRRLWARYVLFCSTFILLFL